MFKRLLRKITYIGNVVPSYYLVKCKNGSARKMPCNLIRLKYTIYINDETFNGLVLSNSELHTAHMRYIKYASGNNDDFPSPNLGEILFDVEASTNRRNAAVFPLHIVSVCQNGSNFCIAFSPKEFSVVSERSSRLNGIIKKLSIFHRLVLWLNKMK